MRFLYLDLALELADLVTEQFDLFEPLTILLLSLANNGLQDFNLLVEESDLVIFADQLRPHHVTLRLHRFQLLLRVLSACY